MSKDSFSALGALVGPQNIPAFLAGHLERAPYLASTAPDIAAGNLLSIDDIDRFFSTIKYRTAECFCVNGDVPIDVSEFAYRGVVDSRKALRLFDQGATIILNRVHLYHSPLSDVCTRLAADLSAPCQANVYLTPPNSKGFNLHYDTHDVFMLQSSGAKQWRVYGPALELPLAGQGTSERLEAKGAPIMEAELKPNQTLYIPRGWMHEGSSTSSHSLHITFGVYFFTWADAVLESVSQCLLNDSKYRSALPVDFLRSNSDAAALEQRLRGLIADVASTIDVRALKQSLRDQYEDQMQTNAPGLLKQIVFSQRMSDDTRFHATSRAHAVIDSGDGLVIAVPGGKISVEKDGREAAKACLSGETISIAQLARWLPGTDRFDLVKRLIAAEIVKVIE